ncbi:MAG: hypothetical protein ABIT36_04605 [Steroidobacteraceae bacterium]
MLERGVALVTMLRAERWSQQRLAALREKKLRRLLAHAAQRIPFYRHIRPDASLATLPVIDKTLLRAAGADAWDGPESPADRWISTSGSTGQPYRFPITRAYDQRRKAQYLRPYLHNGRGIADEVVRLTYSPRSAPWFNKLGLLPETQLSCDSPPALIYKTLLRRRATVLQGYPSALRQFASWLRASGAAAPPMRAVFTDSELLTPATRRLLTEVLGTPVTDVFGTFETDNIAYQCAEGRGYHVTTDCVIVELLIDGRAAGPGEAGELVVTVLDNLRSPFIRYNLRDIARWAEGPCPCGSSFPVLNVVKGRSDDLLLMPDGSQRSPMQVLGVLDRFDRDLIHYQLRQRRDGSFEVAYVPAADAAPDLAARLEQAVQPLIFGAAIRVSRRESIPLTRAGKLRAFVSDTGPNDA